MNRFETCVVNVLSGIINKYQKAVGGGNTSKLVNNALKNGLLSGLKTTTSICRELGKLQLNELGINENRLTVGLAAIGFALLMPTEALLRLTIGPGAVQAINNIRLPSLKAGAAKVVDWPKEIMDNIINDPIGMK